MAIFTVSIVPSTGEFKVCRADTLVASGEVFCPRRFIQTSDDEKDSILLPDLSPPGTLCMTQEEVYREFRLRGYEYGPEFCGILKAAESGEYCMIIAL
jgi:fatty acid synthase